MQAQNTLYYAVQFQHNKVALFIVFTFANVPKITQRIACNVATALIESTNADIAKIVTKYATLHNASKVQDRTSAAVSKHLFKNDRKLLQLA